MWNNSEVYKELASLAESPKALEASTAEAFIDTHLEPLGQTHDHAIMYAHQDKNDQW